MAHDWNEMVTINLPKNGDLVTKVTVNGRTYEIERGKPTEVPYPVYERLQLMLAWDQTPPAKVPRLTWADLGESIGETTLQPTTIVNIVSYGSGGRYATNPFAIDLVEGETYTVTYDGVVYECTCEINKWWGGLGLGVNDSYKSLFGQSDGVYPFCYAYDKSGNTYLSGTAGEHTISIRGIGTKYNPIPAEYLPAGVGGGTTIFVFDDHRMCDMDTGKAISADEFYAAVDKGPIYVARNGECHLAAIFAPNGDGVEVKLWTGSSGYVAVYTKEVELSS